MTESEVALEGAPRAGLTPKGRRRAHEIPLAPQLGSPRRARRRSPGEQDSEQRTSNNSGFRTTHHVVSPASPRPSQAILLRS